MEANEEALHILNVVNAQVISKVINAINTFGQFVSEDSLANTKNAIAQSAQFIQSTWQGYVSGKTIPGMKDPINDKEYAQAIKIVKFRNLGYDIGLFGADEKLADKVEKGTEDRDLKTEVDTWKKKKISKDGTAYAHIPFGHSTKSLKQAGIYKEAKQLNKSKITGNYKDKGGVTRLSYAWAKSGKLKNHPADKKIENSHKSAQHQGMVRFETSSSGAENRSSYMSFRTVSAFKVERRNGKMVRVPNDPDAWVIKGRGGLGRPLADIVLSETSAKVNKTIEGGIEADLKAFANYMQGAK